MVFRHISKDLKERALWLLDNDYIGDDVCAILGISRSSLYRWKHNQEEFGMVTPPQNPLQGRPRILDADQTNDLLNMVHDVPEMYLDEIQDWVAVTHELGIGRSTLHELIRDAGITYKVMRHAASERDEGARQNWVEYVGENLIASMIITVDESSKDGRAIFRRRGRAAHGQRATINANFVRGERYSILAAMGVEGYLGTRIVPGSVDGDEFFEFIVEDIVRSYNSLSFHR